MSDESIFAAAIGKAPGAERRAFLYGACGGDEGLRWRVERLLEADDRTAGILERGPEGGRAAAQGAVRIYSAGCKTRRGRVIRARLPPSAGRSS